MHNLDKIKLVVFDFDNTLYVHDQHHYSREEDIEYYAKIMKVGTSHYKSERFVKTMKKVMDDCYRRGIMMGLCSHTPMAAAAKIKLDCVSREYGYDLFDFCSGESNYKTNILKAIAKAYRFEHNEIMLIDDSVSALSDAEEEGFVATHPLEVYLAYGDSNGTE